MSDTYRSDSEEQVLEDDGGERPTVFDYIPVGIVPIDPK